MMEHWFKMFPVLFIHRTLRCEADFVIPGAAIQSRCGAVPKVIHDLLGSARYISL